ncbi:MAG: hypothetical protein ACPGF8_07620 [Opitutales bacterium]
MSANHLIDLSRELDAIRQKYAPDYFRTPEAFKEAASLWGMNCNDCGVVTQYESVVLPMPDRYTASIRIASSGQGKHLIGIDAGTPLCGFSYAPNVFSRFGYQSFEASRLAGLEEIAHYFAHKAAKFDDSPSHKKNLEKVLRIIDDARQPTLF